MCSDPAIEDVGRIVACGGWSRRHTLFGGDQTKSGPDPLLDPATEPARIRAFFVHPAAARRGHGRTLMAACVQAAQAAGFRALELVATLPGEPLYLASGFSIEARFQLHLPGGIDVPVSRMRKAIGAPPSAGYRQRVGRPSQAEPHPLGAPVFNNLIPKIFYERLDDGLAFFVGGLGFAVEYRDAAMAVISRDSAKAYLVQNAEAAALDRPELGIDTDDIDAVYAELSARAPQWLHPNSRSVAAKPWGSREFAMLDKTTVCVVFREWPKQG